MFNSKPGSDTQTKIDDYNDHKCEADIKNNYLMTSCRIVHVLCMIFQGIEGFYDDQGYDSKVGMAPIKTLSFLTIFIYQIFIFYLESFNSVFKEKNVDFLCSIRIWITIEQ